VTHPSLAFEHEYQKKLMIQRFTEPLTIATAQDVQSWRSAWMGALSSWHSPYKVLVDCQHLTVTDTPDVVKGLDLMVRFFKGFFLKKIVGHGFQEGRGHHLLPFLVLPSEDDAAVELGLRVRDTKEPTDLRSSIQFQNHFQQHTIELSFSQPVILATAQDVGVLRSKLSNNLMQWHSKWSLLIDCANLEIAPDARQAFERFLTVMGGFFMKAAIGYAPKGAPESYPFKVYRARHRAAAELTGEGNFSGDKADCKSRKG
jgi:hypothetical protein